MLKVDDDGALTAEDGGRVYEERVEQAEVPCGEVIKAAARRLDQTGAGAIGWPGRGGAGGGTGYRGGSGVEEPSTSGCSWTGAIGGRTS
jgi:hypothetical protein